MRTTQPELTTERMRLTPVGDVHLPLLVELNSDPDTVHEKWDAPLPGAELGEVVYELVRGM